ncbi:S-adenosyl-L-methionine-dependent methyltransferase [Ceraceosorus guamensis]|uniref:S-adenosyl-L-methionine-dependent methyltransferase n=1 Tax=Ceraceosorus guamensis TaxID=1522189 RepID=A0A316VWX1_9BASI|nr:S-adenosyl-L-methionine-dependent methyltransferase [Ceraceosorus guamensis]PWN42116.1 S-adenosyl-L-methionine-dependent methyltransferase [Ceraceosorus guamensis]
MSDTEAGPSNLPQRPSSKARTEPENNADFQTRAYWDKRYALEGDEDFDWFKKYGEVRDVFRTLIPDQSSRILMLGTGNSTLSKDMYVDGFKDITNIDFSTVLVERMRARQPETQWMVMDVRDLASRASELGGIGSWDIVIDKATLDALMATGPGESVWDPSPEVRRNVALEVDGVMSLLKPATGKFIYLTFAQPHFRTPYLSRPGWDLEVKTLESTAGTFPYYLFVMSKR